MFFLNRSACDGVLSRNSSVPQSALSAVSGDLDTYTVSQGRPLRVCVRCRGRSLAKGTHPEIEVRMAEYSPMQNIGAWVTRRDAGLDVGPATWDEVAETTSRLPLRDTCFYLSLVAQLAASPRGLVEVQHDIASLVEPPEIRTTLMERLKRPPKTVLAHPVQFVAAWRELASHASVDTAGSFEDPAMRELFWQWLMMMSEAIGEDESRRLLAGMTEMTGDSALSLVSTASYLTSRDIPGLLVARHFELLDRTLRSPELERSRNRIDVVRELQNQIGCDWRTFHAIGCALAFPSIVDQPVDQPRKWAAINPDTFFPPGVDRDVLHLVVERMSCDLPWLRARYEELEAEACAPPDPLPIQERPLISLRDGRYCPAIPRLLVESFTLGTYHALWNAWRERTGQPRNQFTTFWGELLESYVDSLFLPVYPHEGPFKRLWLDQELPYDGSLPADVLVDCGDVLVLFEVTQSGFTRQALVAGDTNKIREDLDKTLVAKASQLDAVIGDFRAGEFALGELKAGSFRRLLPVIIVWQNLPVFQPIQELFRFELASRGILQGEDVLPVRVLLMDECEGLLAAVHAGENLLEALTDRRWNLEGESFTNFRHRVELPLDPLQHPVLRSAMERLTKSFAPILGSDS